MAASQRSVPQQVLVDTQAWLERAVIGLNLCPFAKAVHVKGQIHYAVSSAGDPAALLVELAAELRALAGELVARLRSAPAGVARKVAGELRAELDRDWSEPS